MHYTTVLLFTYIHISSHLNISSIQTNTAAVCCTKNEHILNNFSHYKHMFIQQNDTEKYLVIRA